MHYKYECKMTCSRSIEFDLIEDKVFNIVFYGGCNGNLKAIAKLCEGMSVSKIEQTLKGNTCGFKPTSCADQFAIAVREAYDKSSSN